MRAAPSVSIDRSYRQTPPQPHRSQALSETMETPRSTAMLMQSTTNSLIRGIHYQPHNASLTSHMSVGEMREVSPGETSLQRSVNVQNFPPRIEPSPSQDPNPPRRKSLMQAITN
ncbi:unnamed protein product [Phytomonas sp. EM1]|nr:unnamed protein product [Phytomonas sp. EM1]|eukprot:CCW62297.1 unnamed protein product [Phytomonas sp. isolate EM1]